MHELVQNQYGEVPVVFTEGPPSIGPDDEVMNIAQVQERLFAKGTEEAYALEERPYRYPWCTIDWTIQDGSQI